MKHVLMLALMLLVAPLPATAQQRSGPAALPRFPIGIGYDRVRASLIKTGWTPLPLSSGRCGLDTCPPFREVVWCTGVGAEAPCFYAWRKANTYLMVTGGGEADIQAFLRLRRCASITQDQQYRAVWHCN
jgi:hypothetical protein